MKARQKVNEQLKRLNKKLVINTHQLALAIKNSMSDARIVGLRKIEYGIIEFYVESTVFMFTFLPKTVKPTLKYRHMEATEWLDNHLELDTDNPSDKFIKTIQTLSLDTVLKPIASI